MVGVFLTILGSKRALLHPSSMMGGEIHLYGQVLSRRCELEQVHEQEGKYVAPVDPLLDMMRTSVFQDTPESGD